MFRHPSAFDYNIWHHYTTEVNCLLLLLFLLPLLLLPLNSDRLLKKKRKICLFLGRYTIPRHENNKTNTFTYILQTAAALVALWKRKWWKWFVLQKYTEKWSCLWLSCQFLVPIFFWCILALPFFNHFYQPPYPKFPQQPIKALENWTKVAWHDFKYWILNIVVGTKLSYFFTLTHCNPVQGRKGNKQVYPCIME